MSSQKNSIEELESFFNKIYVDNSSGKNHVKCLYFPVFKILSAQTENDGWVEREKIEKEIQTEYGFTSGNFKRANKKGGDNQGGLALDHCLSQRFSNGEDSGFLSKFIEFKTKNNQPGDEKFEYRLIDRQKI
jgi:hypothetical protein